MGKDRRQMQKKTFEHALDANARRLEYRQAEAGSFLGTSASPSGFIAETDKGGVNRS